MRWLRKDLFTQFAIHYTTFSLQRRRLRVVYSGAVCSVLNIYDTVRSIWYKLKHRLVIYLRRLRELFISLFFLWRCGLEYAENAFVPWAFPRTPFGSSRRSPRLLSRLGRGHRSPDSPHSAPLAPRPSRLRRSRLPLHIISGYATARCVRPACISSCPCGRNDQCCYVCMIYRIYTIFYPLMIHVQVHRHTSAVGY